MRIVLGLAALLVPLAAAAQSSSPAGPPASAEPVAPAAAPPAIDGATAPAPAPPPDAAAAQPVDILEFAIRGNTVLTIEDVDPVLAPFTGPGKTVADVNRARKALEELYQGRGFRSVVIDIPEQNVSSGIIVFDVVEARVGEVKVVGASRGMTERIVRGVPEIETGRVPNFQTLQAELAEVNKSTVVEVTPVFRAGAAPGTVDLDLNVVQEKPVSASLELNDQNSRSTERLRLTASAAYSNLWNLGHSVSGQYQFTPQKFDQVQVYSLSYFAPLPSLNSSLVGYAVYSNTDVATLGGLTVLGDGLTLGIRYIQTLPRGRNSISTLSVGADYKDFEDSLTIGDLSDRTPVEYLPFSVVYRRLSSAGRTTLDASIGTTFAIEGIVGDSEQFGGRRVADGSLSGRLIGGKRAGAEASFLYAYGSAKLDRILIRSVLSASARFDWQLSADPLISNQQFAVGSVGSVRGYRSAELLGDSGASGTLQLDWTPPLTGISTAVDRAAKLRLSAFVDGGYVLLTGEPQGDDDDGWLGSAGVGAGLTLFRYVELRGDLAYIFNRNPALSQPGIASEIVPTDFGRFRGHFSLLIKY